MTPKANARIRRSFPRLSRLSAGCGLLLLLAMLAGTVAQAQVATSVVLSISPGSPAYTTPSAPGAAAPVTPTTLTAIVTETASGKPVTSGTVTFYDQPSLDRTIGRDPIGTAYIQGAPYLTPSGTAQMYVALGPGQHQFYAMYNGTTGSGSVPNWAVSGSNNVTPYVSGQALTTGTMVLVGADGSFINNDPTPQPVVQTNLYVYGYGLQYPPGTATVTDQTTSTVYNSTQYQEQYSSLGQTISMDAPAPNVTSFILADPFQAGVPSIVAFYSGLNAVYTIDINRKQAGGVAASATGCTPCSVAASPVQGVAVDLNNDGRLDLVIAHEDTTGAGVGVGILFNTLAGGTQTYGSAEVTYQLGHTIAQVAVGDVNGDGYPDIVALTADGTNLMIVLLNDGTGHFTQQATTYTGGNGASQIALGDFTTNGILSIAVLNPPDNTVGILLGTGTGTFNPMVTYQASPTGAQAVPAFLALGHFANNNFPDTNLDVAVISNFNFDNEGGLGGFYGGGSIFRGNGDGTFGSVLYVPGFVDSSSAAITGFSVKDLDGDGLPDLLVSYANNVFFPYVYNVNSSSPAYSEYLLQDGYTGQGTSPVDFTSVGVAAGDVNGDGVQDIVLMNPSNPNFPSNPAHDSITVFINALYSAYTIPDLIASPVENHTLVGAYAPATGSIYAPATSAPVIVPIPNPGVATFSPTSINFGSVAVGANPSPTQTLTITDTGTGPLEIPFDYFSSSNPVFQNTTDGCAGTVLAPNGMCTITFTFTPTAGGPATAQFAVNDSQLGSPQYINISGSSPAMASDTGTTIVLTASNTMPTYVTPSSGGSGTTLNPVTLTATVTITATGQPVTGGFVTFYDNPGVPGAAGPSVIGSTALQFPVGGDGVAYGIATLPFAFGPGPHTLTASYSGTPTGPPAGYGFAPSRTASPVNLTSNGYAAQAFGFQLDGNLGTIAYINPESSPDQVNFIPNQDPVYSYPEMTGFGMQIPTGTTTVTDQTTGIVYPMAGNDYADINYNLYYPQLVGDYIYSLPESMVGYYFVADVFQSGVPALITLNAVQNQVWINNLFSNPNSYGGCEGGQTNTLCAVTTPPVQGLAADINGDGRLDLVIAHNDTTGNGSVGVLTNTLGLSDCPNVAYAGRLCAFGNPEATYGTGHPEAWVQVGDLNGDGFPDIVALSSDGTNLISVLLGIGDGTFTTSADTFQAGNGASQFYLGDFNQDGILDIAVLNKTDATIGILLGNGDGTFQTMLPYAVGNSPTSFAMADLNLDGFPDFAITNNDGNQYQAEVSFLYGQAGGTFNYVSNPSVNALYMNSGYVETNPQPTVITLTDLNGDGYPDMFIGYNINQYTFALWSPSKNQYIYTQTAYGDVTNGINVRTNSLPVADLDGDGVKDELFMPLINNNISCGGCSPSNNNLMVHLTGTFEYGWSGLDQIDSPVGNHTFVSNYTPPANSLYQPAAAGPITIPIAAEPILTLTPTVLNLGLVQVGTTGPSMSLVLQNNGNAAATNLTFSIAFETPSDAGFSVTPGTCGTSLAGGGATCQPTITFSPGTATNYIGYVSVSYAGGVVQAELTGNGSSNSVGYVNVGETVHLTDTVTAAKATMVGVNETIILTDTPTASLGTSVAVNETIHLTDAPTASNVVVINDNESIHMTDVDTPLLSISINDAETIHVTDVDSALLSISIADVEMIHVTDTPGTSVTTYNDTTKLSVSATTIAVGGSVTLTATVTESGTATIPTGTVNFFDGGTMIGSGTLSGGTVSYTEMNLASGTHTLSAMYLGNSVFPSSTSPSVQVTTSSQTILTVTPNSLSRNFGVANPTLTYGITGFTGGDTIAVVTGAASVSTTAVQTSPAGSYPITATSGSLGAPSKYVFSFASGTLTVNGNATETISFAALPNVSLTAVPHETLTAHSTSGSLGQPITYSVTGPATISGNTLTLTGTGTVTVTAMQAGNSTFAAAANVARTFTVTP